MKKTVLNYRILIEKEKTAKGEIFVSYVPSLGISDFGETVDEATQNTERAVKFYLHTMIDLKKSIPETDAEEYFVVNKRIEFTTPAAFA